MNLYLRPASRNDFDAISSLDKQIQEYHYKLRPDIYRESYPGFDSNFYDSMVTETLKHDFYVCLLNDKLVGYFICNKIELKNNPVFKELKIYYIDTICVDEASRKKGIGQFMIDHIFQTARDNQYDMVQLNVEIQNQSAVQFYEKNGFKDITKKMYVKVR